MLPKPSSCHIDLQAILFKIRPEGAFIMELDVGRIPTWPHNKEIFYSAGAVGGRFHGLKDQIDERVDILVCNTTIFSCCDGRTINGMIVVDGYYVRRAFLKYSGV